MRRNYSVVDYTIWTMNQGTVSKFDELPTAYALLLKKSVGAEGFPEATCWEEASAIGFERDWRGEQADPQRATAARLLWNAQTRILRFFAPYRDVHEFQEAPSDGWRVEVCWAGGGWASGISRELSLEGKPWGIRAEMIIGEKTKMWRCGFVRVAMALAVLVSAAGEKSLRAQEGGKADAPTVKKVEPPN